MLKATILKFPLGNAVGPSGLRPQHLQDVCRQDAGAAALLLEALDAWCLACLQGDLPAESTPYLCGAKLIPLRKPGAKMAVRPIAVGETLRRIVGKVAMAAPRTLESMEALVPTQLGVGVDGACETTAMAVQSWVQSEKGRNDWGILQVDLTNAFNCIDRGEVLRQVAARAPHLSAWARLCYAQPSHLFLGSGHPLRSEQGVQQGDPLGPLFFSLCWQQVVDLLPSTLEMNIWYLDDGHLVGSAEALGQALRVIVQEGQRLGWQ